MSLRWVSAVAVLAVGAGALLGQACREGSGSDPTQDAANRAGAGGTAGSSPGDSNAGGASAGGNAGNAGTQAGGEAGGSAAGAGGTADAGLDADAGPQPGVLLRSAIPYDPAPNVSPEDVSLLADSIAEFGLKLFDRVAADENSILSPQSIEQCLAMLYVGARGQTEDQMADTLRFPLPQQDLHPAFNALAIQLESRATPVGTGSGFELELANGVWVQDSYLLEPGFLDVLSESYDSGVWLVDFANDAAGARDLINTWISDRTKGKITDLATPDFIHELTRLAVGNTLYFRAAWASVFSSYLTYDESFMRLDGSYGTVQMMHRKGGVGYVDGDGFEMVTMDYAGYAVAMQIIVPDEGQFASIRQQLSPTWLRNASYASMPTFAELGFPKFKTRARNMLKGPLIEMGMPSAFSSADFSGLSSEPFSLWDVAHESVISVDEDGTEAAGATLGSGGGSPGFEPIVINVNRPFLYVIQDKPTGAVLFVGQYVGPALP